MMKLSFKAKRNIGLVALTIAVVVAIILIVYYVEKADLDEPTAKGGIVQTLTTRDYDLVVEDLDKLGSFADKTADSGQIFFLVKVSMTARKDIKISPDKFVVADGKRIKTSADGYEFLNGRTSIKAGETKDFYLMYQVKKDRMESFFLRAYNCKVDLGGSMEIQFG